MNKRIYNFSAGPAALPHDVMLKAQTEFNNYQNSGYSIIERSHRTKEFDSLLNHTIHNIQSLLDLPSSHEVLLISAPASLQFAMLPMNFLPKDGCADYAITGRWAQKAFEEAQIFGNVNAIANGAKNNFHSILDVQKWHHTQNAAYLHFTSNNTVFGTQLHTMPKPQEDTFLACDMSSDILSRQINVEDYGLIYAGLQKNLGPSGMTMAIIDSKLLTNNFQNNNLPNLLNYKTFADYGNLYNTPNTFAIYLLNLTTQWLLEQGGISIIERINDAKSEQVYECIDRSGGFYQSFAAAVDRSKMNICFNLISKELEEKFLFEAEILGLIGLKGHRSVGGIRASIYNAMPLDGVSKLIDFMEDFKQRN